LKKQQATKDKNKTLKMKYPDENEVVFNKILYLITKVIEALF